MDRINHSSAEADKFGAGKDGFTDGDPSDPSSGTIVNEDFLDGVQEELIGLIEAAGETPTNADYTQLADVILARVAAGGYQAQEGIEFDGLADTDPRLYDHNAPTNERYVVGSFGIAANRVQMYYYGGAIEFAYNCYWSTGVGWVSTGSNENWIVVSPASATIVFYSTLVSNSFTKAFYIDGIPDYVPTTASANRLYPAMITKVAGWVQYDSSAQGTFDRFNIGIADATSSTSLMTITFDRPFTDYLDFSAQVTSADITGFRHFSVSTNTDSTCIVVCRDEDGVVIDPTANNVRFYIELKGPQ